MAVVEAVVSGAVLGSLADWLFAGILFHERYQRHPEVWRGRHDWGEVSKDGAARFAKVGAALGFAGALARLEAK